MFHVIFISLGHSYTQWVYWKGNTENLASPWRDSLLYYCVISVCDTTSVRFRGSGKTLGRRWQMDSVLEGELKYRGAKGPSSETQQWLHVAPAGTAFGKREGSCLRASRGVAFPGPRGSSSWCWSPRPSGGACAHRWGISLGETQTVGLIHGGVCRASRRMRKQESCRVDRPGLRLESTAPAVQPQKGSREGALRARRKCRPPRSLFRDWADGNGGGGKGGRRTALLVSGI